MTPIENLLNIYKVKIGYEVQTSDWFLINQDRINKFASATGDNQWIHIDSERAKNESPYGTTIAHGFLTLSLIPMLTGSNAEGEFQKNYPGMKLRVNYGLNKVRFPAPVPVNSKIRAKSSVKDVEEVKDAVQIIYEIKVEIEGSEKPACIAEQIFRLYP
ncbi:MAG: MaoC family dehydratase [Desulfuromonadales bacterium]|nr:MaoC family dehydratase [Desulfuromonadales bacterium]